MRQFNIHITPEFEANLNKLMKYKNVKTKSEALRLAVQESLDLLEKSVSMVDFNSLVGLGKKAPENKKCLFKTHDDLWK